MRKSVFFLLHRRDAHSGDEFAIYADLECALQAARAIIDREDPKGDNRDDRMDEPLRALGWHYSMAYAHQFGCVDVRELPLQTQARNKQKPRARSQE